MNTTGMIRVLPASRKCGLALFAALLAVWICGGQPVFSQQLIHSYTFDKYEGTYGSGTQTIYNNVTGLYDATLYFHDGTTGSYTVDETAGTLSLHGDGNGNGAYVQLPNDLLTGLNALTIITEVSFAEQRNWMRVFDLGVGEGVTDNYIILCRSGDANQLRASIKSSAQENVANYGQLQNDTMYHTAYTYAPMAGDPSQGVVSLYIDGEYHSSVTGTNPLSNITANDSNNGNHLGRAKYGNDNYFSGTYDSFSVYDNTLGTTAIRDSYRNGTISAEALAIDALIGSAVGFWDGARGKDSISAGGIELYYNNTFPMESRTLTDYAAADTLLGDGRVLVDTGDPANNKHAESRSAVLTDITGPLTVSTRVCMESFNDWNDFIRSGSSSSAYLDEITYGLGANKNAADDTTMQFRLTGDGEGLLQIDSDVALETGKWYDVTGVFDPANDLATLYVYDSATGDLLDSVSQAVDFNTLDLFSNALNFMLFESPGNNRSTMDAMMDYIGVWDCAFTADQVGLLSGAQSDSGAVPEPAAWVMMLLGAAAVLFLRRKHMA